MTAINFQSPVARKRIDRVIEFTRHEPRNLLQIADEIGVSAKIAGFYLRHLRACGALVLAGKQHKSLLYKSTGAYYPDIAQRPGDKPVRAAPHVKPFRCEWATAFFGPATDSREAAG